MNRKIFIEPVARVEGHGGIEVLIERDKVKDIKVDIFEGPRLIEKLVIGKSPEEAVSICSRICAICFVSHRLSEIISQEKAMGIKPGRKTQLLRKLAHYGEMIESHSLHYYLLALPDYFGYPDAIRMLEKHEEIAGALELKKYGNKIMEIVAGRRIHGENMRIGGFGKYPEEKELEWTKAKAYELIPVIENGIKLWEKVNVPDYSEDETIFMSVDSDDEYAFIGDRVKISTGEVFQSEEYAKIIKERVVKHSFSKRCRYKGRPYSVGALARIINSGDKLDGLAKDYFTKFHNSRWLKNPLFNNIAQAIEILYCLEKIPTLVDEIRKADDKTTGPERKTGSGVGIVEAPRGLLIHYNKLLNGKVDYADYIIPTTQNLDDMEKYMRVAAENLLRRKEDNLELPLEMIMRAYDPCISCSVHMVRVKRV